MALRVVLFDLDNTIYPASNGLLQSVDRRIGEYLQRELGLDEDAALALRRHYYREFGTTLRGLRHHHQHVEIESYLQFVHDVALDAFIESDQRLSTLLAELSLRKVIFTNSPREYAERVLDAMGITHHFERLFDVRYFDFVGKPDPSSYMRVLRELGVEGVEAMMVEDTAHNLPPAKALGMTTVLIHESLESSPDADFVVRDVHSAIEIAHRLAVPTVPVPK